VAAPTAGLHFSKHLMKRLEIKGINFAEVTLHIGLGTFNPIEVEDISKHKMESEEAIIDEKNAEGTISNATLIANGYKTDKKDLVLGIGTPSAQALVNKPNLLLLDEFTSNLDKTSEIECMTLVKDITKKENIITLCITHELSLIDEKYIDKILYLEENCFKFISIKDYNEEKSNLKLCKHFVGDTHYA